MKIGVVGCGALGSFYGAKLCAAGQEVHFLLRSDYAVVRQKGVQILSVDGDFQVRPHCALHAAEIGSCDLVLIGLKTTANREFDRLVPPLLGPDTAIATFQNGLGSEELLARLFGKERVMGGLCFVCLNRISPGVIKHTAHGDILLGEFGRSSLARTHEFCELLVRSGIRCKVVENLEQAHWEKLVWNIPFNGLGVAGVAGYAAVISGILEPGTALDSCLSTDRLLATPAWEGLVRELMTEVIRTGNRLGFEIPETILESRIQKTREMGAYKASTLIDFERGQALELESLFMEPLRRAQAAGVDTPRLKALCQLLAQLDRRFVSR